MEYYMIERRAEDIIYVIDVSTILEMKNLKEGKTDNSYLQMCQYLTNHSDYEVESGKSLPGMPNIKAGAYAVDIVSGDVKSIVSIKDAYCNARYNELKEAVCEAMDWPLYITLDLDWILTQYRKDMRWKKENNLE